MLLEPVHIFFDVIQEDSRIAPTHISLYMALLDKWGRREGVNSVLFRRSEIMSAAKILSRQTYYQRIHDLRNFGYIKYAPALSPFDCSSVSLRLL